MSQGILCLEMGTKQQLSSCLKEELRNKQAWRKAPLKHSTEERGGESLGPMSALGRQISACTASTPWEKCQRHVILIRSFLRVTEIFSDC